MKALRMALLILVVSLVAAAPALAQQRGPAEPGIYFQEFPAGSGKYVQKAPDNSTYLLTGASIGAGLGAAITILGAGYGFSRIGSAALESMARQPEVAGRIQTAMLIIAALLEGATFFALIVCILVAGRPTGL